MGAECLLRHGEESPGEFSNATANRPTKRALLPPKIQIIFSAYFQQVQSDNRGLYQKRVEESRLYSHKRIVLEVESCNKTLYFQTLVSSVMMLRLREERENRAIRVLLFSFRLFFTGIRPRFWGAACARQGNYLARGAWGAHSPGLDCR
jgi:hypothetical protein